MNKIKFSHNWNNKLSLEVFTTIRRFTDEKFTYYKENEGKIFDVELEGTVLGKALLIEVDRKLYKDLPLSLLRVDTGMTIASVIDGLFFRFGINEDDEVIILTFEKIRKQK